MKLSYFGGKNTPSPVAKATVVSTTGIKMVAATPTTSAIFMAWKVLESTTEATVARLCKYVISGVEFNSLTPGRFGWKFRKVILKLTLIIDDCSISCKIAFRGMSLDLTDDKSTLAQVMAWCRQATSHYLSQCCPRSLSPYGITRPHWVNTLRLRRNRRHFADDIFKCIFFNENVSILIKI